MNIKKNAVLYSFLFFFFIQLHSVPVQAMDHRSDLKVPNLIKINGAGSSGVYPLLSKWFYEYKRDEANIQFNYQSVGSGAGIKQLLSGVVDFAISDVSISPEELARSQISILQLPLLIGAVSIVYNTPSIQKELKVSPSVLSDIFMGKIQKWNDPQIQNLNPDVNLPKEFITVVYRSDGSGATALLTQFFSRTSSEWKQSVGAGKAVRWPVGVGGKGNEGVAGMVQFIPYSLGYMDHSFALTTKLKALSIQSSSGEFVSPTLDSVSRSAQGLMELESLGATSSKNNLEAYPVSGFVYFLVPRKSESGLGPHLQDFLMWAYKKGQPYMKELAYASLPQALLSKMESEVQDIK